MAALRVFLKCVGGIKVILGVVSKQKIETSVVILNDCTWVLFQVLAD